MTPLVLRFKGGTLLGPAMDRLQQQFPGVILTPKTSSVLEAMVDDSRVPEMQALIDWDVQLPSYAEISPPSHDWSRFRDDSS